MKAWELLEQKGWCQGYFSKYKGCSRGDPCETDPNADEFCVLGALHVCYPNRERFSAMYDKVDAAIKRSWSCAILSRWNDDPQRTKEQVVAVLKEADA